MVVAGFPMIVERTVPDTFPISVLMEIVNTVRKPNTLNEFLEKDPRGGLDQVGIQGYASPYDKALVYTGLGNHEQALNYLKQAIEERASWIVLLNVDPRFAEVLKLGEFVPSSACHWRDVKNGPEYEVDGPRRSGFS